MAERKMLARKRRSLHQQPIVRLKRASDEISLSNLKQYSHLFPLNSKDGAVKCLQALISPKDAEPDLTLISIVLGALENVLTKADAVHQEATSDSPEIIKFVPIRFEDVKSLYHSFYHHLRAHHSSPTQDESSTNFPVNSKRSQIRMIADKVWILLARSYRKDKLRMQFLYSLLTDHKLDSFGVTSSVVAACQLLGLNDVNMVMSEDHSWIEFGEPQCRENMEVTWHGKCTEDKRGTSIKESANKWIYSANAPVRCSAMMTAALLASQLNPYVEGDIKSHKLLVIKRELMWFLHKEGLLCKLPMALIELAKTEMFFLKSFPDKPAESATSNGDDMCLELLQEAVDVGKELFENRLVYPYLELGEYFYKKNQGNEAFHCWANAADIISLYNYGKEDEEVYKRFYEVANESFISLLKKDLHLSSQVSPDHKDQGNRIEGRLHTEKSGVKLPLCRSPQGFADFLRFYDGMCCWEEDSATPVLHVKWAQSMCAALLKFHTQVRTFDVDIRCTEDGTDSIEEDAQEMLDCSVQVPENGKNLDLKDEKDGEELSKTFEAVSAKANESQKIFVAQEICLKPLKACNTHKPVFKGKRKRGFIDIDDFEKDDRENPVNNENDQNLNTYEEFQREINKQFGITRRATSKESENPILEVLSKNCSNSIFNPEFFQGRGEPFLKSPLKAGLHPSLSSDSKMEKFGISEQSEESYIDTKNLCKSNLISSDQLNSKLTLEFQHLNGSPDLLNTFSTPGDRDFTQVPSLPMESHKKVVVLLKSSKMRTLRDLLVLERLNTQAIKLQLTAQSNTIFNKNKVSLPKQSGLVTPTCCPSERVQERELPDGQTIVACGAATSLSSEGDGKAIVRRVLRNRVGK